MMPRFAVVILAAGASRRMGQPKLLLPWGSTSVLGQVVSWWRPLGAEQLAVVVSDQGGPVAAELDRLGLGTEMRIWNPEAVKGMFSSAVAAALWAGWSAGLTHWIVCLGDQPHLQRATLERLIDTGRSRPHLVLQPCHGTRPRHPIWLPAGVFRALGAGGDANLREFLERHASRRELVDVDDPGLDLDLDTPEDYARLRREFDCGPRLWPNVLPP
jgi:molybdenum cofactor cytidylyltransferase